MVFSHGWPLSADAFEDRMVFLGARGYRCIAHDRRGHGRSSQPWNGNEMDTYAADLAAVVRKLDLKNRPSGPEDNTAVHPFHAQGQESDGRIDTVRVLSGGSAARSP